jgi:2'-5' RNA ligase
VSEAKRLFFIALLPPQELRQEITGLKEHFAEVYESRAALKSPPHITLHPPFKWQMGDLPPLAQSLEAFAANYEPIPIPLAGFGAFIPRVIYIKPLKTPELIIVYKALQAKLEAEFGLVDPKAKTRAFSPHVTVAFRDLKKSNFRKAWEIFETKAFEAEFTAESLTLLLHNGKRWEICQEFPFQGKMGQ